MGESRRKRDKRSSTPYKSTDKLPPLHIAKDKIVNDKQRVYCRSIIEKILSDEASLSFSKPVDELWDRSVLTDYFDKIKRPMDLGTVKKRCQHSSKSYLSAAPDTADLFDPNRFREEARLVFTNAIFYNGKSSDLGKFALKFMGVIDNDLDKIPTDPNINNINNNTSTAASPSAAAADDAGTTAGADMQDVKVKKEGDHDDDGDVEMEDSKTGGAPSKVSHALGATKSPDDNDAGDKAAMSKSEHVGGGDDEDEDEVDGDGDDEMANTNANTTTTTSGHANESHDDEVDDGGVDEDEEVDDGPNNVSPGMKSELGKLDDEISRLYKLKSRANANLAEIELEKNVPLSYEENSKLRDEVEALPWEISQKVVKILKKYVDDALKKSSEQDPEFVTLEFSTVEPKLLREIEDLIRPDTRVEKEKVTIMNAEKDIEMAKRKQKRLKDVSGLSSKKKRSKKSR